VGSFFTQEQAKQLEEKNGYVFKEDAGRGFRRVVASPLPKAVVEEDIIKSLINEGHVVIAVGGGGIPIIKDEVDGLQGIPAVIDKDFAAEKLAEIIEADEKIIEQSIVESSENSNYLKEIIRFKPHVLHPEVEKALSALSGTLNSPQTIYNRAKLSDMDFKTFTIDGKEYPLSFVLFENEWEYERDTKVRRAAFDAFSTKLREYQHTVAAAYQTQIQKEKTLANLRGFDSVIDSLLFSQEVDKSLYDRQIDLIMEKLAPHMRKYVKLLQKIHKLDEMTFADLKLVVDPSYEPSITVEESKKYTLAALSVLGEDYSEMVNRAYDERWIDFVQNKGKSTGAFCSSPYGSHPYILISWTERMREVFVLSHELGHAGHFHLAHQNQNIFDSRPSQ
jgi:oligoendopeptidase F